MIKRSLVPCIFLNSAIVVGCGGWPAQPRRTLPRGIIELHILASKEFDDHKTLEMTSTAFLEGGPTATMPEGYRWFPVQPGAASDEKSDLAIANWKGRKYVLAKTDVIFSLDSRTDFQIIHFEKKEMKPPFGWVLQFELDKEGAAQLKQITSKNVNRSIGFFLRGELVQSPSIRESVDRMSLSGKRETIEPIYEDLLRVSLNYAAKP